MNKKIVLGVLAVLVISLIVLGIFKQMNKKQEKGVFKIGANFTFTGGPSFWADEFQKGLNMSLDEHNAIASNKMTISIIFEDNRGKSNEAVTVMNKFINVDKVGLCLSLFANVGNAIKDLAEKSKMPLLVSFTSTSNFGLNYKYVFRDFTTQDELNIPLADYVFNDLHKTKGALYVVNDDYGKTGAKIFDSLFTAKGGKIFATETFDATETNHKNTISKLISKRPEFIVVLGRGLEMTSACKQIREINKNIIIVGQNGFESEKNWQDLGQAGNGIYFTNIIMNESNSLYNEFVKSFTSKFNKYPNYSNVYGYSIGKYLFDIIEATEGDKDKIVESLGSLSVETIRGRVTMEKKYHVSSPIGMYCRINNKTELLKY